MPRISESSTPAWAIVNRALDAEVIAGANATIARADADAALQVHELSHAYGARATLTNISFTARRGEVIALLGLNGAGKSTLLSILAGLKTQSAGTIFVAGSPDRRNSVGYSAQDSLAFADLTVAEQLKLATRCFGIADVDARVASLMKRFGLHAQRDKLAGRLSGGMLRRLNVALALVSNPSLLLLDEPSAGLDPENKAALYTCILQEQERGAAVLMSTHDLDDVALLATRVMLIHDASIAAFGTPKELLARLGEQAYLEIDFNGGGATPSDAARQWALERVPQGKWRGTVLSAEVDDVVAPLAALTNDLQAQDLKPTAIRTRKASLADVFFSITGHRLPE